MASRDWIYLSRDVQVPITQKGVFLVIPTLSSCEDRNPNSLACETSVRSILPSGLLDGAQNSFIFVESMARAAIRIGWLCLKENEHIFFFLFLYFNLSSSVLDVLHLRFSKFVVMLKYLFIN